MAYVNSRAINKTTVKYRLLISRLDDMLDLMSVSQFSPRLILIVGTTKLEFDQGMNEKLLLRPKIGFMNDWLCPLDCPTLQTPS